ncbi:MAG: hypothetical protein LBB61_10130 [Treponema sp.]|jgi:hypothetical protein|nr:hypothetical protein [Treponema sp.]
MADLYFEVDTSPMASTVDSVKSHVRNVATAVTAMEAAVIATERQSAKTICENVDNGFYILMKSQICQKVVAAYTEMTSKQMTLLQLAKALDNVKKQMEADYNMISKRYTKLFHSLNKALETRIKELDRPAMRLADIRKSIVFDKLKDESSLLFSSSGEVAAFEQTALSGKLKQKTKDTLKTLSNSITETQSFNEKIDSILLPAENEPASDMRYIPALFLETDSLLNTTDAIENAYVPHTDAWQNAAPVISEISRIAGSFAWKTADEGEKTPVRKEFVSLCEKEVSDPRLSKEMLRLFDESSWEDTRK